MLDTRQGRVAAVQEGRAAEGGRLEKLLAAAVLLQLAAGGVVALLLFWRDVLHSDDFASLSLPLVALVAAIAATFNPCSLPALPGFLALAGAAHEAPARRRIELSAAASVGAAAVVVVLGALVALAGSGTKALFESYFRWVQLAVGLFLIAVAVLHLAGRTSRLPLVGSLTRLGSRAWETGMEQPTPRSSLVWGAGFVAVGAGWTGPFLAAVAVFATGVGGFLSGFLSFVVFAVTMAVLIFLLAFLGGAWGPALARPLRLWGRRVQAVAAGIILVVGAALVYAGINPGVWDRLILR